jgi:hypothetical protein
MSALPSTVPQAENNGSNKRIAKTVIFFILNNTPFAAQRA